MDMENLCLEVERSPEWLHCPKSVEMILWIRSLMSCQACSEAPEVLENLVHLEAAWPIALWSFSRFCFFLGRCLHGNATFGSSQLHLPGVNATAEVLIFYGKLSSQLCFNEASQAGKEDGVSFPCVV